MDQIAARVRARFPMLLRWASCFVLSLALPAYAIAGSAACSPGDDAAWWDGFGLPIISGELYAATVDSNGSLIVGGFFDQAGTTHAANVVRWDSDHWSALAQSLPRGCRSLAWWNGRLVAGCQAPDDANAHVLVYVFDGATWSPLGSFGPEHARNYRVSALTVYNGDLIAAGGFFQHADGESVGCVARWDGAQWRRMGTGGFPIGDVTSMAVYNDRLFVTGNIFNYDAIAQWDGTSWSTVGAGLKNQYGDRGVGHSLLAFGGYLYLSGDYAQSGGTSFAGLGRWDGTSWSSLGTSVSSRGSGLLCTYQGDVVASGAGNRFGRWNGSSWISLDDGQYSDPRAMLQWGDRLLAIASYLTLPAYPLTDQILQFDGASWSPLVGSWSPGTMAGVDGFLTSGVTWHGRLVVGNAFKLGAQDHFEASSPIAAWDGTAWASIGPAGNAGVNAITIWNDSLVVGMYGSSIGGVPAKHIARWDGTSWKQIGAGFTYRVVYGLTVYDGQLIATGQMSAVGDTSVRGVARWDGEAWRSLGSGLLPDYDAYGTCTRPWGSDLIVGGRFAQVGGVSASNIARWDGASWHALGSGLDDEVYALAEYGGDLIVGGDFTRAGGIPAAGVARWNGSSWSAMGDNAIYVGVLRVVEGRLFAAGTFWCGGDEFHGLAAWDGQSWMPIGSGSEFGGIDFIEPYGGDLYVGGSFGWMNGHASFNIARWIGYPTAAAPTDRVAPSFVLRTPRPNPSLSEVRLEYELPRAMEARLAIFDAMGRRIATLASGRLEAGRHVSAWTGRDDRGRARGAGLYFGRLETLLGTRTVKIVRDP